MYFQPLSSLPTLALPWPAPAAGPSVGLQVRNGARDRWLTAFVARMSELRPSEDEDSLQALAAELWEDVGSHDPDIAAEMEHEASFGLD